MELYDFPLLVIWVVALLLLWSVIYFSLNSLKHESGGRNFLVSFKIELVWLFLIVTTLIISVVNRFDTQNNLAFAVSLCLGAFACVFGGAFILYKSAGLDDSKSIFRINEKKSFMSHLRTSAITFVFATIAAITVFGIVYLVADEIEKLKPKSSVEYGLYDI
jgi:hypothetical protein